MKLIPYEGEVVPAHRIPVEYVVLHYTAENLAETLRILREPSSGLATHLVVSPEGVVHELLPCWNGTAFRGAHAGQSRWNDGDRLWERFNDFSIGIEIVNLNGNLFLYTSAQYEAIGEVLKHLKSLYPALQDPDRIVGHEQIAGWRGKVDPGVKFDWTRLFLDVYPEERPPVRTPACPPGLLAKLQDLALGEPPEGDDRDRFWRAANYFLEASTAGMNDASA